MNFLDRFSAAGVRFRLDGDHVVAKLAAPVSDEVRAAMKELKEHIKSELEAIESRRERLQTMLSERPDQKYAVIYDSDATNEYDILVVGIPGATCEVRVPKPADSLDFVGRLLTTMDRHAEAEGSSLPAADSTRPV